MNSAAVRRLASLSELACLVADGTATTRGAVVGATGLSRAAIAQRVDLLIERGLLVETEPAAAERGRPPLTLDLSDAAILVAGVDLGATHSRIALATLSGRVLAERARAIDINDGPDAVLAQVRADIKGLLEQAGRPVAHLRAIGIGVPGPVEAASGTVVRPPIMLGWDGCRVPDYFGPGSDAGVAAAAADAGAGAAVTARSRPADAGTGLGPGTGSASRRHPVDAETGLGSALRRHPADPTPPGPAFAVLVDNDVNIMALGEYTHRRSSRHLLYVKVGTGIGCGIVSAGIPHRGASGAAGDIGHIQLPAHDDVLCHCGNTGCVEAVASGSAVAAALREAGIPAAGAGDVVRLVSEGNAAARRQVRLAGQRIGEVLASIVSFYNPDTIVIGGILAQLHEDLLADVRGVIYRRALPLATRTLAIETSVLGERAGVMGAVRLSARHLLSADGIGAVIGDV